MAAISWSFTSFVRPSLATSTRIPGCASKENASTPTSASIADGSGDDVAMGVDECHLRRQLAMSDHLLGEAVVLADLDDVLAFEKVRPAVADVDDVQPSPGHPR